MSALLTTKERVLVVALLLLLGGGVLWVLVQTAPPVARVVSGLDGSAPSGPEAEHPPQRPAELPPVPALPSPRRQVLLVPLAGAAAADLVLASDGSWGIPPVAASRPASGPATAPASAPASPAPAPAVGPLVVALPAPLAALDARARGSLVRCLEVARRSVEQGDRVLLPPDAAADERAELERLRGWLR